MNCEFLNHETEIADLSGETLKHLENCADCRQSLKLREVLTDLEKVSAPKNFNFQLKSRWQKNQEKSVAPSFVFAPRTLVFSSGALAICLVSSWFALSNFNFSNNTSLPASTTVVEKVAPNDNFNPVIAQNNTNASEVAKPKTTEKTQLASNNPPARRKAEVSISTNVAKKSADKPVEVNVRKNINEEILRRDSTVRNAPKSQTPQGIPDPLSKKETNAESWLEGFGMKTSAEGENLRVVSVSGTAENSGVQKDDVIEQFNGKKPREISTNNLPEIVLTVRREGKLQEIKLKIKTETEPQNQ